MTNPDALRLMLINLTAEIFGETPLSAVTPDPGLTPAQAAVLVDAWSAADVATLWDLGAQFTDGQVSLADLVVPGAEHAARMAALREAIASTAGTHRHDTDDDADGERPIYTDDPDYRPFMPPEIRAAAQAAEPTSPETAAKLAALRARLLEQNE
jgi:hypothetical protein